MVAADELYVNTTKKYKGFKSRKKTQNNKKHRH